MRILLNKKIEDVEAGTYFTPRYEPGDGYYIGSTKLKQSDYDEVPDSVQFEDAIYIECDIDCDEDLFDLSVSLIENERSYRAYSNSMKIQFIEYEPVMRKMDQLEARVKILEQDLSIVRKSHFMQIELNRKLSLEVVNAMEALRPLYNIPVQDFDYFDKPNHVIHSWTGKSNVEHKLTVQHVIDARKVIDG